MENYPTMWGGQYSDRSGASTVVLEAVVDCDLWIGHTYFGMPWTNNDINVIELSHLFHNLTQLGIACQLIMYFKENNIIRVIT